MTAAQRADYFHIANAEGTWKDRRRFLLDKTPTMVAEGRRTANSRQKKKVILLPTVQC